MLSFVNVKREVEFTEQDIYGSLIKNFDLKNSPKTLLEHLVYFISTIYQIDVQIDWELELKKAITEKNDAKKEKRQYNKSYYNTSSGGRKKESENPGLAEWLKEIEMSNGW